MQISVIIPVLNEAAIIGSSLKTLAALDGIHEIIVVDGGSIDKTVDIAGKTARVISSPRGRSRQMNAGSAVAGGSVFLFLHIDTILPENAANAIENSLKDPRVIGGRFRLRLDNKGWRYQMLGRNINMRDHFFRGFTGDQAIFVRREVFKDIGGYPPVDLMEDLELGRRMCRKGRVVRLSQYVTTSARRWRQGGLFRTVIIMWTLRFLYYMGCPPSLLSQWYGDAR
jgi:rSAM/selenodomain-associated transferase 2